MQHYSTRRQLQTHWKSHKMMGTYTLTAPTTGIWLIRGFSEMRTRPRMYKSDTPARMPRNWAIMWPIPSGTGKLGSGLICTTLGRDYQHTLETYMHIFGLHLALVHPGSSSSQFSGHYSWSHHGIKPCTHIMLTRWHNKDFPCPQLLQ